MPSRKAGSCWSGAEPGEFLAAGSEVTAMPLLSCQAHLGDLAAALIVQADASSVLVTLPGQKRRRRDRLDTGMVAEQVRRIGLMHQDPEAAEQAEHDLFAAVLAAIADGAQSPVHLATAALVTMRYRHTERRQW